MQKTQQKPIPCVDGFQNDPLFPRIERVVASLLTKGSVVTPIEVLVGIGILETAQVESWRRGQIPYLERVINCNLTRLGRMLRILRLHAHDLNLVPSVTKYMSHGKGTNLKLRFTKTGDPNLEEAYARHFMWPGKRPFQ